MLECIVVLEVAAHGVREMVEMIAQPQSVPMTIQVLVPLDKKAGDVIEVMSPGGKVVSVMIPPGVPPGPMMEVQNPDAQAAVTAKPGAPLLGGGANPTDIQNKVHGLLRDGKWQIVPSEDALAYSRTLTPAQSNASNPRLLGCHKCRPVSCIGFTGCVCTYNFACGENCLCFPCCTMGIVLPLYSCLCFICERSPDNTWIARGENGMKTGELIVVDHERGTYAHYGGKCCGGTHLMTPPSAIAKRSEV